MPVAFSVEEERTLPAALRQAIKENEAREIRMTFEDGDDLYLIRGYGEQKQEATVLRWTPARRMKRSCI